MAIIHRHRETLRRDQLAIPALHGKAVIIMQAIGIMHRLHPAANIVVGKRIDHPRRLHRFADVAIKIRAIEGGAGHDIMLSAYDDEFGLSCPTTGDKRQSR
jgi:hypothetical protein